MEDKERRGISALRAALRGPGSVVHGLNAMVHAWGGEQRCFSCYLQRCENDPVKAAERIQQTLSFRKKHALDAIKDVGLEFDRHPLRKHFPTVFAGPTPEGCVVQFTRLEGLRAAVFTDASQDDVAHFVTLWLEASLRRQGEITRDRGEPCPGVVDVYDCAGFKLRSLLLDVSATRALSKAVSLGTHHYPENMHRCFVINAPSAATLLFTMLRPLLHESTQAKVSITSRRIGVPPELKAALGGSAAVDALMAMEAPQ